MAERRMFARSIVESDAFLDMPLSARCLYFALGMVADDDGFVGNPKSVMRQASATQDDLKLLIAKRFVLSFESGVIVIKHWRINNYLRNDRYKPTTYVEELKTLALDDKGAYTEKRLGIPHGIPAVYQMDTQYSIGKDSILEKESKKEKISLEQADKPPSVAQKHKYGKYKNVLLTEDEHAKLLAEERGKEAIEYFSDYRERKGYKAKSDYLSIKKWVFTALDEETIREKRIGAAQPFKERTYSAEETQSVVTDIADLKDMEW